ncbi:tail fiber domain-containing protein [Acinetobacter pollinis]|uniref:tail fiber domain-containing protein n=1 Tax=Acinetobacter pollinis TaxID=2605270 RepID=UPI0018A292FB|nr:tail fiber domain-containing protein [Acinetobacter pollinis]MBF7689357.1 tail fiber domain-containing protein [Acinetobacter pollinis]MBF7692004.1 tail fiber domain-containing protein [Acinetobacter pollinis]MBF7697048.1 tail fiber domain-containing protein [Acinetobacter pollinis]MBF7700439.1 tail fiber domain-containing protein [Acinetobacter pollinis]
MTIVFRGKKILPNIDLNKITIDGDFFMSSSNTYINSPVSGRDCHLVVKSFDRGNQQIEQTLTERATGYVYKRILYNSYAHAFPASNTSISIPWYRLYGVGQQLNSTIIFDKSATYDIGSSLNTINNLYMQNAVTVVSDENYKTEIQDIPDNVLDAWSKVNFQMYKLNAAVQEKGCDARFHFGVIAQRIKDAFDSAGLDFNDYGLLTYDKWDAIQAVEYKEATYDQDGNQTSPEVQAVEEREAGEVYMVRYDECMILEMAYQRKCLADIKAKLKS